MNQKLTKTTSVEHYVDEFTRRQKDFENDGLQQQRRSAIELFQQNGFPTTRQENWKYTDVRSIARHTFSTSTDVEVELSEQALNKIRFNELACHELVLINGQYSSTHSHLDSLPDGVIIKDLVSALAQDNELLMKYITQYTDNNVSSLSCADALKIVAEGVNSLRNEDRAIILVTHYQRLLNYIKPNYVHVLSDGKIIKSGGPELSLVHCYQGL